MIMVKLLNRRNIAIQLIILILISSILIPSISSKKASSHGIKILDNYNVFEKSSKNFNIVLSSKDADLLLELFYDIEQTYGGVEKIRKQIEVLREYNILSDDDLSNRFLELIDKIETSRFRNSRKNGVFVGPTLISHFTPGSRIHGYNFTKSWYYDTSSRWLNGFLNNTILDSIVGAFPIFLGVSSRPVFITAVNRDYSGVYTRVFFLFFELLLPCVGFSVCVKSENEDGDSNIIFEYNLDFCLFGILKGF